jgi:hypothetical protein
MLAGDGGWQRKIAPENAQQQSYIILNGRFEPSSNLTPPYTLQQEEGREATITDYCLASIDQFQRIKTCTVIPNHVHNLPTDHNPIHLHLLIPQAPQASYHS